MPFKPEAEPGDGGSESGVNSYPSGAEYRVITRLVQSLASGERFCDRTHPLK